ncbi:helix-turn-helix domain-containing protein [Agromyces archimandritae]|uniref:Helix-turn-helix domain-containing protein n=1 Tax=Agromyces archimandritae TaxID=2781962 RepID=A0A975FKT3_9MICO|nr:helix-turn-helix domain-containing protein [Agromyces archimandritae]QTX03587.1 helix-turn-helix domain-containing protein [Agromyces archimandritae]
MPTVPIRKYADLGAVMKAAREGRGLTQEELAESLGFGRDYLGSLESGKPGIFAARLFRTLTALGVKVTVSYEHRPR